MQFHKRAYKPMDPKSMSNLGTDLVTFQSNQLQGLNQQISTGAGSPEVATLKREVWEGIPKPHFKEMRRLSNLTGVEPSIHAPMIDAVGINPQEKKFSEEYRKSEEKAIEDVIDKAHLMAPDRNVVVNIHSEVIGGGTSWRKYLPKRIEKEMGKEAFEELPRELKESETLQVESMFGVDRETGQIVPLKSEVKHSPTRKYGKELWDPDRQLRSMNATQWTGEIEGLHQHEFRLREIDDRLRDGNTIGLDGYKKTIFTHADSKIEDLYHKLVRYSLYEEENWNKLSKKDKAIFSAHRDDYFKQKKKQLEGDKEIRAKMTALRERASRPISEYDAKLATLTQTKLQRDRVEDWSNFFAQVSYGQPSPERIIPLEDFEIEKASKTFAEAAEHSLFVAAEGNVNKAPVISIENPPAMQFGLSRADELKKLVIESRKKAVELFTTRGMGTSEAKHAAEKLIGITWDVGHINLLKKGGYKDKDIIAETKKIAPYVKHMHLTDNFGTQDSHLVPGMGNVPIKEMQKEIDAAGFKGKSIIEAGGFIANFKTSPWPYVLDHMDSPIYEFDAAATWKPAVYGFETGSAGYPVGYGNIFPPQHFAMYGAGFLLPPTFGSATPGESKKSEFSGTPMS